MDKRLSDNKPWRFNPDKFERDNDYNSAAKHVKTLSYKIYLLLIILSVFFVSLMASYWTIAGPIVSLPIVVMSGYYLFYYLKPEIHSGLNVSNPMWIQLQADRLSEKANIQSPLVFSQDLPSNNFTFVTSAKSERTDRTIIIISNEFINLLTPSEIRSVLAHEIAHINFHDLLLNRFISFIGVSIIASFFISILSVLANFILYGGVFNNLAFSIGIILSITVVGVIVFIPLSVYIRGLMEYRADMFSVQHTDGCELYTALASVKGIYPPSNELIVYPKIIDRMKTIRNSTGTISSK